MENEKSQIIIKKLEMIINNQSIINKNIIELKERVDRIERNKIDKMFKGLNFLVIRQQEKDNS